MRKRLNLITCMYGALCALLTPPFSAAVNAAEWSAQPSVRLGQDYNDNVQLTIQPHDSATGSMISPKLDLGVRSNIWQVTGAVEAVQKRFSGQNSLNRDDRFFNLITSYNTERSTWRLAGSASKNSVITSEQINPDTGLVTVQRISDAHSVNPSWTWAMNELTQLQLAYSFSNVSYVNGKSAGLSDYSTRDILAQLTNRPDPNDEVFFSARYSIFNVPSTAFESKSTTYQAGITRTFSGTLRGTLSVGTRKTSAEQIILSCASSTTVFVFPIGFVDVCDRYENRILRDKSSSSVFNGSIEKQYETTHLSLTFSRSFDPSATGGQVQIDSQNVGLSRQLSERLSGNISLGNYNYGSEAGGASSVDRHFYAIQPGLQWKWTPELQVDLNGQYQHIKRGTEDQPATSRAASLSLRYVWPKMGISR